ncbi:MAG: DUF1566 domain-containing protein [Bacteroidales bacterium]
METSAKNRKSMHYSIWIVVLLISTTTVGAKTETVGNYPIVGTNQSKFYDNTTEIKSSNVGSDFFGQNACYPGNKPEYKNNGDGTISDLVTGLMWQQSADKSGDGVIDITDKESYSEALAGATSCHIGGYSDWRLPSIKELYSLILFSGLDVSGSQYSSVPFIDTRYFGFGYGDTKAGERLIDAQFVSSTCYVDYTMNKAKTVFGVNFADGRIKGYGLNNPRGSGEKKFYRLYVRGNLDYGKNKFTDNKDGTISDSATGLMWMQEDSGKGMNWQEALSYAENHSFAGFSDWRLPDAKELQSIIDYGRSPSTSNSAAIDPLFNCTKIVNEAGIADYPCYWSSTTHTNSSPYSNGSAAVYLSFGRGMGYMWMLGGWVDVHGAGCQRSDPKTGNAQLYPRGRGPQGDAIRIANYVRLVRTINPITP